MLLVFYTRYKILAPTEADKAGDDPKKVAQVILDIINMDAEQYRMGHTKACNSSSSPCTSVLSVDLRALLLHLNLVCVSLLRLWNVLVPNGQRNV